MLSNGGFVCAFPRGVAVSLFSVMQTALTGMAAAEATLGVVADNLANARTDGFKARRVRLATQTPQTVSLGEGPHGASGGTNPQQIGAGVQVAGSDSDFSQGSIAVSTNPSDLALNGEGLFIVEGASGERLYTRQGRCASTHSSNWSPPPASESSATASTTTFNSTPDSCRHWRYRLAAWRPGPGERPPP